MLLYTDLANPVSNSIYQKLGYRPVADHVTFDFAAG
ncbi:GNAT family N-acetyltransferase [Kitasatospora arboriphila]